MSRHRGLFKCCPCCSGRLAVHCCGQCCATTALGSQVLPEDRIPCKHQCMNGSFLHDLTPSVTHTSLSEASWLCCGGGPWDKACTNTTPSPSPPPPDLSYEQGFQEGLALAAKAKLSSSPTRLLSSPARSSYESAQLRDSLPQHPVTSSPPPPPPPPPAQHPPQTPTQTPTHAPDTRSEADSTKEPKEGAAPRKLAPALDCDLCSTAFEESGDAVPRLLACSHTYCHRCLVQLAAEGERIQLEEEGAAIFGSETKVAAVECPRGCGPTPVGSAGADALPVNAVLVDKLKGGGIGDFSRSTPMCEECDGVLADMWCDNCDAYFCRRHFLDMHTTKIGKRHKTAPAIERPKRPARCATHAGQEYVLYCRTCEVLVCRDCCSLPFKGLHADPAKCDVVPLEAATEQATSDLRQRIRALRGEPLLTLQNASRAVQARLALVDVMRSQTLKMLTDTFAQAEADVLKALEERRDVLTQQVQAIALERSKKLSKLGSKLGVAAAGLVTACGETEGELRTDSTSALKKYNETVQRLNDAREEADQLGQEHPDKATLLQMVRLPGAAIGTLPVDGTALKEALCSIVMSYGDVVHPPREEGGSDEGA